MFAHGVVQLRFKKCKPVGGSAGEVTDKPRTTKAPGQEMKVPADLGELVPR